MVVVHNNTNQSSPLQETLNDYEMRMAFFHDNWEDKYAQLVE